MARMLERAIVSPGPRYTTRPDTIKGMPGGSFTKAPRPEMGQQFGRVENEQHTHSAAKFVRAQHVATDGLVIDCGIYFPVSTLCKHTKSKREVCAISIWDDQCTSSKKPLKTSL
jgi:hypothetical protein